MAKRDIFVELKFAEEQNINLKMVQNIVENTTMRINSQTQNIFNKIK